MGYGYYGFRPYVSVAERRRRAQQEMAKLAKKGMEIESVAIEGRKIATTFWGQAWCDHLESFSDFANRLPRGRTYVRNGSVCHLGLTQGQVEAKVGGSEIYDVKIKISTLPKKKWNTLKQQCIGQIGSLLELLSGELSDGIMQVVTDRNHGLFPQPGEITFDCDCPDWAEMCKHVAAVLYGIGARLDHRPEYLFELRGVDVEELIQVDAEHALNTSANTSNGKQIANDHLADIFGIDIAPTIGDSQKTSAKKSAKLRRSSSSTPSNAAKKKKKKSTAKKRTSKTSTKKKTKTTTKKKTATPKKRTKASAKKKTATPKKRSKVSAKKKTATAKNKRKTSTKKKKKR